MTEHRVSEVLRMNYEYLRLILGEDLRDMQKIISVCCWREIQKCIHVC